MAEPAPILAPVLAPGDFVNDIVIVCTLAILIGQNLRADIQTAVDSKIQYINDKIAKVKKGSELNGNEYFAKLYEKVNNFVVFDTFIFMVIFYICILLSVLLDLIILNQNTNQVDLLKNFPTERVRFYFELVVWIFLTAYGLALFKLHKSYETFVRRSQGVEELLSVAESVTASAPKNGGKNHKKP